MHRNISWVLISVLLAACLLTAVACQRRQETVLEKTILKEDTTWQGDVRLNGDVMVDQGVTLTIAPGTVVRFTRIDEKSDGNLFGVESPYYPEAELIVRGRLLARGTADDPIVFTSAAVDARPRDWGAINFLGSNGNELLYCKVLCAYNGVHSHGSEVTVRHCEFVKNGVAISFKSEQEVKDAPWFGKRSRLTISDNLITSNKGGIGFRNSDAVIEHNEITANKFFGLFAKEDCKVTVRYNEITENRKGIYLYQARGVQFLNNNIYDNRDYNIAPAEAQDYPLTFANTWFGTVDRRKIDALIFDHQDDPELAVMTIAPVRRQPVAWERNQ